jgi:hypothetical protein
MDSPNQDELVTIAEVDSEPEFIVVRSLLESAGVECFSPDFADYYVKGKNSSCGIIRVQVRTSQANDAVSILKDAEAHPISTEPDEDQL